MVKFDWIENGDEFILKAGGGRAVITQFRDDANRTVFTFRIETHDGKVASTWDEPFREFEDAEQFAIGNLDVLDMPDADDPTAEPDPARLERTLEMCMELLPTSYPSGHRIRLELIKKWVRSHRDQRGPKSSINWRAYSFEWSHGDNHSTAKTPYGLITMRGPNSGYPTIRLTDPSGVEYDNPESGGTYLSFEDAETRARELLAEVDNPDIEEVHLSNIEFTLTICQKLLPPDADPMHFMRLGFLMQRISDILL